MTADELRKKYGETATIPRDCPWVGPPDWWDKGLKAWGELLTEQWEIAQRQPKTEKQRRREAMFGKAGEACARQITEFAIAVLTEEEARDDAA